MRSKKVDSFVDVDQKLADFQALLLLFFREVQHLEIILRVRPLLRNVILHVVNEVGDAYIVYRAHGMKVNIVLVGKFPSSHLIIVKIQVTLEINSVRNEYQLVHQRFELVDPLLGFIVRTLILDIVDYTGSISPIVKLANICQERLLLVTHVPNEVMLHAAVQLLNSPPIDVGHLGAQALSLLRWNLLHLFLTFGKHVSRHETAFPNAFFADQNNLVMLCLLFCTLSFLAFQISVILYLHHEMLVR